jgi:uncharacterized protein
MGEREARPVFRNCHPEKLPVFRADLGEWAYFYAPGRPIRLPRAQAAGVVRHFGEKAAGGRGSPWRREADALERAARRAARRYEALLRTEYSPVCLTAILTTECRMACRYCFATPSGRGGDVLAERTFRLAARQVAANCRRRGKDFVLVLHGGGEPTIHMDLVRRFHAIARMSARDAGAGFFSYIATSGVMSDEDASWLGRRFSRVGLSCDGPPSIQDRQRPRRGGGTTSDRVERTARIIRREGGDLSMRATLTPASLPRLEAIVRYGRERLGVTDIRAEPVYRQPGRGFAPRSAGRFVDMFIRAQKLARELGGSLSLSGARPEEVHGPYCQAFRDVLQLNPDGTVSACFLAMMEGDPRIIGRIGVAAGSWRPRADVLRPFSAKAASVPPRCVDCVNRLHCVRECPDRCPLEPPEIRRGSADEREGFRCRVQRRLTEHWIIENARLAAPFLAEGESPNA